MFEKQKKIVANFWQNKSGMTAPIFALATIPILLATGSAVDYTRVNNHIGSMQSAVDSAVLAAGPSILSKADDEVKAIVKKFIKANLSSDVYALIQDTDIIINKKQRTLTATLAGETPMLMMGIMGINELEYNVTASTEVGTGNVEIVMVLDNTYSMSVENKLNDLKSASTEFVNELMKENKDANKVKIGIVPFARYVNVGVHNRNKKWLSVPADITKTKKKPARCYMKKKRISGSKHSCKTKTSVNDGVRRSYSSCKYRYGPKYKVCKPAKTSTSTKKWHGCVGSRNEPWNLKDERTDIKIPGLLDEKCSSAITEMTHDKKTLTDQISAMRASGSTYIPAGLMWGLRLISGVEPFTNGTSYANMRKTNTKKTIVLMTDGDNQNSARLPKSPKHDGKDFKQANQWTKEACEEIKSKGIDIYAVTFGRSIRPKTKSLMENCATTYSHYYHAVSGRDLKKAFGSILTSMYKLRLTK